MMECLNNEILGLYCIVLKNIMIHEINQSWIQQISTEIMRFLTLFHHSSIPLLHGSGINQELLKDP
jgi:hypothetical protein